MSEFDKHWNEWVIASNCTEDEAKIHFEAGQQSQQAKIDLLEKELTETQAFLNNQNHIKQAKIDELQGRIGEALDYIAESGGVNLTSEMALNHILKGNKDEN